MNAIEGTVKSYILEEFLPGANASDVNESTPLISGGILDSLATVKLVAFLEEQYKVTIEPHEASVDYLDTIRQIADLVRSKRA
ncbi:MAG TPA: acyl carrier protein [Gemmatimonadaceae bacterium]|jgi:acyl carrier protein|nr:acyl carrier protein [Gemmatimonadaceae bacterium]